MMVLIFPSGTVFPMPNGAYSRNAAGEIVLRCTREQLEAALLIADAISTRPAQQAQSETETDRILRSIAQPGDVWVIRY